MKTRQGFVSNSSSSSFIVCSKNSKIKIETEVDLADISSDIITTKDQIEIYFDNFANIRGSTKQQLFEDEYFANKYNKMVESIQSGDTIYVGSVSNYDCSNTEYFLYRNGFKEQNGLKVIINPNEY